MDHAVRLKASSFTWGACIVYARPPIAFLEHSLDIQDLR